MSDEQLPNASRSSSSEQTAQTQGCGEIEVSRMTLCDAIPFFCISAPIIGLIYGWIRGDPQWGFYSGMIVFCVPGVLLLLLGALVMSVEWVTSWSSDTVLRPIARLFGWTNEGR